MFTESRYMAVRALIVVFTLLGALPLIIGAIATLNAPWAGLAKQSPLEIALVMLTTAVPIVVGLALIAIGQLMQIAIDIEANTRRAAEEIETEAALSRASRELTPART